MTVPSPQLLKVLRRAAFSVSRSSITSSASRPQCSIRGATLRRGRTSLRRSFATTAALKESTASNVAPKSRDRGPTSNEDTQTDFDKMDIFSSTAQPATTIDACLSGGFHLNNGAKIDGGDGVLLIGGQAFAWRPWLSTASQNHSGMLDHRGAWQVPMHEAWGVLDSVFPKPDLLILGVGRNVLPVGRETKEKINRMGIRVDIQDTRNAAAEFNLLATERGVNSVVAALVPIGWDGTKR